MLRKSRSAMSVIVGLCLGALAILNLSIGIGCKPCKQHGFCLDWLRIGDTYRVELVQHLGPEFFEPTSPIFFGRTPGATHTCGTGFDLDVGETMKLLAELRTKSGRDECVECYYAWA